MGFVPKLTVLYFIGISNAEFVLKLTIFYFIGISNQHSVL